MSTLTIRAPGDTLASSVDAPSLVVFAGTPPQQQEPRATDAGEESFTSDMFPEACVPKPNDPDLRYTTRETIDYCKRIVGVAGYTLDVAADEESHHAGAWYGVEEDGLSRRWFGDVWANVPFSDCAAWVKKAWAEWTRLADGDRPLVSISMLLPCNRTEQPWWHEHVEPYRDLEIGRALTTHFLPGRTRFGRPGNVEGVGVGSPPFGCVLLVWRRP